MGVPAEDIAPIIRAIGNHDEELIRHACTKVIKFSA